MYCSSCASPIPAGQTFCPACGTPVQTTVVRPAAVHTSRTILLAAVALSLVNTIYIWSLVGVSRMIGNFSGLLTLVFVVVWVALILLMWSGKKWARLAIVAITAWTAINFLMYLPRFVGIGSSPASVVTFASWIVLLALRLYAVYLLFRPESSAWFNRRFVSAPA